MGAWRFRSKWAVRAVAVSIAIAVLGSVAWYGWDRTTIAREDVRFVSDGVTLAGTLFRPRFEVRPPAIVLVHGSGATDRTTMHYFARAFARHGIAALAYDKRGVGESEGEAEAWKHFSFEVLASDAAAGVRHLRGHRDLDGGRVGLFGVSQGAWVAPLAAEVAGDVAFLVLMSASVATVAEDRLFERAARLRSEGFEEAEIAEAGKMHLLEQQVTRDGKRFEEFKSLWEENRNKRWFRRVYLGDAPSPPDAESRKWERMVQDFDPLPIFRRLNVPMFFIFGDPDHDRFAPVALSVERVEELRRSAKGVEIRVFEGADHNLQLVDSQRGLAPWGREAAWQRPLFAWLEQKLKRRPGSR